MSVLDFSQMGASLSVRSIMRRGSQLSIFGMLRLGASLALLDFAHLGGELSIRSFTMLGSDMRIEGTGGDLGFDVNEPLKVQGACRMGSSFSVFGRAIMAQSLSVVDFLSLGSSVSLRSFARLSSSVSVLSFGHVGSSLSLRSFCRIGSAISLRGMGRIASHLSVGNALCITTDKILKLDDTWTINWDIGASQLQFKVGAAKPLHLTATGGSLHGTWMSESIISASDRRLKREVRPLLESLRGERPPKAQIPQGVASSLLGKLVPSDEPSSDAIPNLRLEASEEAQEALPGVVRDIPGEAAGKRGISYQDLLAVITMAAKERQQRLDALEELEAAENAQYNEQEELIQVLLQQVKDLSTRFARLRFRYPRPPQWPPPKP